MNRLAAILLCTFFLTGAVFAAADPAPAVAAPAAASASGEQPLPFPIVTGCPADAATFSVKANYCGECGSHYDCEWICGGPGGICQPADYNPRCGVCICA